MNQPELGKKILELRLNKGLTQGELAEICNLSLRTIQRTESAEVTPRSHTVKVILSNLGFDPNHSFDDASRKYSTSKSRLPKLPSSMQEKLRSSTMKKLSVFLVLILLVVVGYFYTKENERKAQNIEGWVLRGSKPYSYSIGVDKSEYVTGESSAFLESKEENIEGFGTIMQSADASKYLGKKVKMSAYIKSEDVFNRAGMWLRVDSKNERKRLRFDNMSDRPIVGDTDWKKHEIILPVPPESGRLSYGFLINGTGIIWIDDIKFEVIESPNVKSTSDNKPESPKNLDFDD
ncbi:helix-turn-helix transcriptional regulator [Marivirga salinae]|uniref:Helix-turn-helix transcriptional regulator n=1 Tax=Marivirga salinarum TaxID=3059078 RepID=A0AA49GFM4_9BACT|nr:helix-turn-helix transcriptional regulator [Marivirga sp. BDSF4-3]WKK78743.2 helix-turn-helix transcriptional regulator [Marivirga sp. BDSF4-3]